MTTATRFTRRELVASWRRGHERARYLGLDAGAIVDDPDALPDSELHARLWALARWMARVEATDYPLLWALGKQAGVFEGAALKVWDDPDDAIAMWRDSLAWWWEIEASGRGGMV